MDLNSARIIITKMEGCFKELDIQFVNEDEMFDREGFSDAIKFRSWLEKNGNLAEILAFVIPSHNIVQLTMNYYENIEDFDQSTIGDLFNLLNTVINWNPASYWLLNSKAAKLEFRTAYYLPENGFSDGQFKTILARFLLQGPMYYTYFKRLIDHNEDPSKLFYEMQVELEAM